MTHTYTVTGMTCSGCVAKVKSALLKIGEVISADVQRPPGLTQIEMSKHIPLSKLQLVLQEAGAYEIRTDEPAATAMEHSANDADSSTSYFPIFLIAGYIAAIAALAQWGQPFDGFRWMRYFMGGFFAVFSFFKLLNISAFAEGYSTYDWVARRWYTWGTIYPFLELLLALLFITDIVPVGTNLATLLLMGVSVGGVAESLLQKKQIQCACLGTIIQLPLSKVTLAEDLLMIAMSAAMLIHYLF